MPRKTALVDFAACRPQECAGGICAAAAVCPHRLLKQEATYDVPMMEAAVCGGCGDCVKACPLKAIRIVRM